MCCTSAIEAISKKTIIAWATVASFSVIAGCKLTTEILMKGTLIYIYVEEINNNIQIMLLVKNCT